MNLEGTDRYQSPYEIYKRERNRVNIALFPGPKTRVEGNYIFCPLCHRNLVSYDDSGNTLICPNCGRKQEIKSAAAPAENSGLKQKNPPISKLNTFAISQQDKSKKQKSDKQKEIQQMVGGGFITEVEEIELSPFGE